MITITAKEFEQIVAYVKESYGLNLAEKKHLLEGRFQQVLQQLNFTSFTEYFDYLKQDKSGAAVVDFINKITTNHTFFMREADHFYFFRDQVLPHLERTVKDRDLRIWSAGCSSGEEPYTLAMIMADYFKNRKYLWDTRILATDISRKVLTIASEGVYSREQVTVLPEQWQKDYFVKCDSEHYRVANSIHREVVFRAFNLTNPVFPFKKKFHVIFCRNVMIYFDVSTKQELLRKFYEHTEPGGYLFIGHAESISHDQSLYRYIKPAVYRKE
ncbi:MAG TPA: protein-glutamate O-methyltransferase CheR [Bacillota bacterium]